MVGTTTDPGIVGRLFLCLFLSGCFDPTPKAGAPCGPGDVCPSGLMCVEGTCTRDPLPADGSTDAVLVDAAFDAAIDARPDAPPAAHTIPPGAALWLKLDDDPVDGAVDSAGMHATTCTSCPALTAGKFGSAYVFTADRMVVTATADLQPGNAFSIAAWIRVDATPASNVVVACKNVGTLDCSYALLVAPGRQPIYYSSGSSLTQGATAMALGTWHHVAITWDGTTKRGYFDGAADGNVAATITSDAALPLSIGERDSATSPISFPGAIDDLVFYNRALTPAEVAQLAMP